MRRAIILIAIFVVIKGDGCVKRLYEDEGFVCVCNSTYCDTIDVPPHYSTNQYLLYTSTKYGERMQLSVNNFSKFQNAIVLTVDSSQKYQKIHGFGGAVTDAVAINIRSLSNETQQKLLESYYGSNGIGYTYCRIPIAGTDFSTRPYTYDDTPGDLTLSNFSLVEEDDYKIGYLHQIKKIMSDSDSLRIITASWSAPKWMKNVNNIKWGFLKYNYYQLYADYIKKFFDAYKEHGIDIWGITPGNEPINGFVPIFPFNAMGWSPINAANWITNYLNPTLSEAGYNPVYIALDDQLFSLPWYVDIMFYNKKAKELFGGIAYHWYANKLFSANRLTKTHDKYPDKFILMTEACEGSSIFEKQKVILGSWERGESYILDIIMNLSHWVSGWIDWNIALNDQGGPNWVKNFVDSPIIINSTNDEFYKQPMHYALAHISKFVPRDSYRISSTGLENNEQLEAVAFLTPKQQTVVVIVNKDNAHSFITIKDKNAEDNKINLQLPARSFNTIIY